MTSTTFSHAYQMVFAFSVKRDLFAEVEDSPSKNHKKTLIVCKSYQRYRFMMKLNFQ